SDDARWEKPEVLSPSPLGERRCAAPEGWLQGEYLGRDVRVPVVAADEGGDPLARHPHDRRDGVALVRGCDGLSLVRGRGELPDPPDGVPRLGTNHAPVVVADCVDEHAGDDVAPDLGPRAARRLA